VFPLIGNSVANTSRITALDRSFLTDASASWCRKSFAQVTSGVDVVLGR
jgi:hypothetical protein